MGPVIALFLALVLTCFSCILILRRPLQCGRSSTVGSACILAALFFMLETPTVGLMWLRIAPPTTVFATVHAALQPDLDRLLPVCAAGIGVGRSIPAVAGRQGRPADVRHLLIAVMVLGALAKPGLVLVLVPGLPLFVLVFERRRVRSLGSMVACVVAPAAAMIIWQKWFLSTSSSTLGSEEITFDPIAGPVYGWARARWLFWLPLVWPLLATLVSRGAFLKERLVRLVLCCMAFPRSPCTSCSERPGPGRTTRISASRRRCV